MHLTPNETGKVRAPPFHCGSTIFRWHFFRKNSALRHFSLAMPQCGNYMQVIAVHSAKKGNSDGKGKHSRFRKHG